MPSKQRIPSSLEVFTTIQRTTEITMLMSPILHWWQFYRVNNKKTSKCKKNLARAEISGTSEIQWLCGTLHRCNLMEKSHKDKIIVLLHQAKANTSESSSFIYNNLACWESHISWWESSNSFGCLLLHLRLRIMFCDINIHLWLTEQG